MSRISLQAEKMRGYAVFCSARVRAENISAKPNAWNGIKLMMVIETPAGKLWPQATIGTGSFDWQKSIFAVQIPKDATAIWLCLGLESVTGKVWFDDVRVTVRKPPVQPRVLAGGMASTAQQRTRLRGAMISPNIDEEGLRVLGQEWGANLIRWQLINNIGRKRTPTLSEYDQWLEGELRKLDAALPWCRKYGLHVVVDLHSPPGGTATSSGYIGSDAGLFADRACQQKFVEVWQRIARRYAGNPVIWGYDLANEPVENAVDEGLDDWHDLAERTAKAIRRIDPERTIIIEPSDWGGPSGLIGFEPVDVPNVVYSVHMYIPHTFTHQNLSGPGKEYVYPGNINGKVWDKAALEAELQAVVDFQRMHGVPIYIGEFSAIRWAPGDSAHRYLKDVIEIFEQHGWDWSYHAFREWQGWSVEHGSDRRNLKPASQPTDRQRLLREWFKLNEKPDWRD